MSERYIMSVSPDFPPKYVSGWYIFNAWLQRQLDVAMRLELYDSFEQQRAAIERDELDLIYANPFDASILVREKGFVAVASPVGRADEALIAVSVESSLQSVENLSPPLRIACTDDPEINMIARILLEPADIPADERSETMVDTYVLVAKQLMGGGVDAGYFLKASYDEFSSIIQDQLRVIISSEIQVVRHLLLLGPRLADRRDLLREKLVAMSSEQKGQGVLDSMDLQDGWQDQSADDTEYMIDLMDTLVT